MYIEQDCTIEHEGKTFESGGAVVTPEYAIEEFGSFRDVAEILQAGQRAEKREVAEQLLAALGTVDAGEDEEETE